MKYIITGGSGFLGSKISEKLISEGHEVVSIDLRGPSIEGVKFFKANLLESIEENEILKNPDVCINLAGKLIFGKWDDNFKKLIRDTRVETTKNLISLFKKEDYKPKKLVQASAVGVYGNTFLSEVAKDWEEESLKAKYLDIKVLIIRNGHILGDGGMIKVLKPYYKFGIGGPIGNGKQFFPWIHVEDVSNLYIEASIKDYPEIINGVAPDIITNKEFSKTFAKVLHRPHIFFIPKFFLKILYGEFANEMFESLKVESKGISTDFEFKYPKIYSALDNLL